MSLVNQPSALPNRKIGAVIVATFLVKGGVGVAETFFPGVESALPAQDWIEALVVVFAGYFTRERSQA